MEDKAAQIAQMHLIFGNSTVTLLAASAPNANAGFLKRDLSDEPSYDLLPITCPDGVKSTVILQKWFMDIEYVPSLDPVNSRAWIFQERMLFSRLLIFPSSPHPLQFHCRSKQYANGGPVANLGDSPFGGPVASVANVENAALRGIPSLQSTVSASAAQDTNNQLFWAKWIGLVRSYSSRDMSDPMDKLSAMVGVANELRDLWKPRTRYVAGLWSHEMVRGLLWKIILPKTGSENSPSKEAIMAQHHRQRRPYRAPSWSWAASDGQVIHSFTATMPHAAHFSIINYTTRTQPPSSEFGMVTDAMLHVEGKAREADMLPRQQRLLDPDAKDPENAFVGYAFLDDQNSEHLSTKVWCLLIVDPPDAPISPFVMFGVVLVRDEMGRFLRIGGFGLSKLDWFRSAEKHDFQIV